jgi:hypothetical protein
MKEFNRITNLSDKEERQRQLNLYCEIVEKKNKYEDYLFDYKKILHEEDLQKRGIEFIRNDVTSTILKLSWENNFAIGLTKEDKDEIYFNQYMWHIYSFEKREALTKTKARRNFNRIKKNHVYVFFQNNEDVFYIDKAELLKACDFDLYDDVYVVDIEMRWTYIHTHEMQCGPYFTRKL